MKLILRADIDNLGRLGDLVNVKPGYGRNYLVPQGMAMLATKANIKAFEFERKRLQEQMDAIRFAAQEIADKLAAAKVVIPVRVGEGNKLYGSVTVVNIAEALEAMDIVVDRRKIVLDEPLRALGEYSLEVKLHPDVKADLAVSVVPHGQEIDESATSEPKSEEPAAEEA
ncbi:MAG: 50S ribosomal protein L9 [Desulfoplanes sp.]